MKGIKLIFRKIVIPTFFIGLLIGIILMFNANAHRPMEYPGITEKCYGEDCGIVDEVRAEADRIIEEYKGKNDKLIELSDNSQKYAEELKKQTEYVDSLLKEAYPEEFYCYSESDETIEYSYEISEEKEMVFIVKNAYLINEHPHEQCALCEFEDNVYEIRCNDKGDRWWEPRSQEEYDFCESCGRGDNEECLTGKVVSIGYVPINKTMSADLEEGMNLVKIPANLSYEQKIDLTKNIKKHECYFNKPLNSSLYGDYLLSFGTMDMHTVSFMYYMNVNVDGNHAEIAMEVEYNPDEIGEAEARGLVGRIEVS